MSWSDFLKLLILSAIWGGSFLFMRVASPEMGPVFLIWLRVALASLILAPVLLKKRVRGEIGAHFGRLVVVGVVNAVLPWCLLAYAVLSLEAGLTSLLNAATPIFAAMIGFLWLKLPLTRWQALGLVIGIAGVAILASERIESGSSRELLAVLAVMAATICYGFSSHFCKQYLSELSPWTVSFGNLISATLILSPFLVWQWPDQVPSGPAIGSAIALGVLSTALAFVVLFDLLTRAGATAVTTVTFIIPIFGVLFGSMFLDEKVTLRMIIGMVVALSGAALATRLLPVSRKA